MVNRNFRSGEEFTERSKNLRNYSRAESIPFQSHNRQRNAISVTSPQVFVSIVGGGNQFQPGAVLVAEYRIQVAEKKLPWAVESSVIWRTEGKGDEDVGVLFFERRNKSTLTAAQLKEPHKISTVLPQSPLSYEGKILRIIWSIRIRVFVGDQQFTEDMDFKLGLASRTDYELLN